MRKRNTDPRRNWRCYWACIIWAVSVGAFYGAPADGVARPPDTTTEAPPQDPAVIETFDPNGPYDDAGLKDPLAGDELPYPDGGGNDAGDAPEGGTIPANDTCGSATVIP